jgi:peptidoglycan/LPS O-acetylase OafA/YrhL
MLGGRAPARDLVTGYRPWMDGVRGVGILAVVAQHTLGSAMPIDIGYYGLAMFFALSGYLITGLLLDERIATGAVSLRAFYIRRAGRLMPALVLAVVVMDALFIIAGDHVPLPGSVAALTYTSNYVQIVDPAAVGGFGPTWSLAVEEHFYLLWPLTLLFVVSRFGLRAALWATLAICLGAMCWRGVLAVLGAPERWMAIGSLERADALLYGCAAAIAVRLGWRPRAWMLWAAVAGVAIMNVAFVGHALLGAVIGNGVSAVASAAIVVCLDYTALGAWLPRLLSLRLWVSLGVVSYGLYLWHGPMMRLADQIGLSGAGWRAVAGSVALVAAVMSHRMVEKPARAWARRKAEELADGPSGGGPPVEEMQEQFVLDPAGAQRDQPQGAAPAGAPGTL